MQHILGKPVIRWKLREVMARQRVTNRDLALRLGMHEGSISRLKSGDEMPRVSGRELEALCQALKCEITDLIERVADPATPRDADDPKL